MIKTNRLLSQLDHAKIADIYDFFLVKTTDTHFKVGAKMLDVPTLENNTCAVYFESGRCFYVMMRKNIRSRELLKKVLSSTEDFETISFFSISVNEIEDYILLQLLLNGFSCYDSQSLRFNNLTGHLYCFHPAWIKKGKGGVIWQVPCLELRVTKELVLSLNVRTFTSGKLQNKMVFKKKKYKEYPKYSLSSKNTLRRKLKDDTEDEFILRQVEGEKSDIPFLDTKSEENFSKTKMGILAYVLEQFEKRYKDLAKIDFFEIAPSCCIDHDLKAKKENKTAVKNALSGKNIRLVDQINDEHSVSFLEKVQKVLKESWNLETSIGTRVEKNALNICLIHNAEYYEGRDDAHDKKYDASVQHITREQYDGDSKFTAEAVVHELLIKEDLLKEKISLFDWSSLQFADEVSFCLKNVDEEGSPHYFFMKIRPDGSFHIQEQENNLFEQTQYSKCMQIFDSAEIKKEDVKGIVMDADGNINVIKNTEWITFPEIDKIKEELASGNNKLRSKVKRDELLSSCLDIKSFVIDEKFYYFVGLIGDGMKYGIHNAANVRQIKAYEESPLFFECLLPLMNVTFVKNEQLTVVPFPFKYLREWIKMKNL